MCPYYGSQCGPMLFAYQLSSKYLLLCSGDTRKSNLFSATGWVNFIFIFHFRACPTESTPAFHRSCLSRLICQSYLFLAVAACLWPGYSRCLVSVWQKKETNLYAECAVIINPSWDPREKDMMISGSSHSLLNALRCFWGDSKYNSECFNTTFTSSFLKKSEEMFHVDGWCWVITVLKFWGSFTLVYS